MATAGVASARKPHRDWLGYRTELRNRWSGGHTVIVTAAEAGLDTAGGRYAVVCDAHNILMNTTSMPKARDLMRDPTIFCEHCRAKAEEPTA